MNISYITYQLFTACQSDPIMYLLTAIGNSLLFIFHSF